MPAHPHYGYLPGCSFTQILLSPPGFLDLWPRARQSLRRTCATSLRSTTLSSQPRGSSAWLQLYCRTQNGCRRRGCPHTFPDLPAQEPTPGHAWPYHHVDSIKSTALNLLESFCGPLWPLVSSTTEGQCSQLVFPRLQGAGAHAQGRSPRSQQPGHHRHCRLGWDCNPYVTAHSWCWLGTHGVHKGEALTLLPSTSSPTFPVPC